MKCPYCASEIADQALVCPQCRRDLYVVKQLLKRIEELEARQPGSPAAAAALDPVGPAADPPPPGPQAVAPVAWREVLVAWLAPVLGLVFAHWLLIFVYDAKLLFLRLLGLVLPLPFGFLFARASACRLSVGLAAAFSMALASVFGMSSVTGAIDQQPILPSSPLEIREFLEFSASIGCSFFTGLWLRYWLQRRSEISRRAATLDGRAMTESLKNLNDTGSAVVAAATTAFSIYTGLKGFLGL